ncbi:MAG: hypothetical protein ABFE07_07900 [Armatimonadia bacterium]
MHHRIYIVTASHDASSEDYSCIPRDEVMAAARLYSYLEKRWPERVLSSRGWPRIYHSGHRSITDIRRSESVIILGGPFHNRLAADKMTEIAETFPGFVAMRVKDGENRDVPLTDCHARKKNGDQLEAYLERGGVDYKTKIGDDGRCIVDHALILRVTSSAPEGGVSQTVWVVAGCRSHSIEPAVRLLTSPEYGGKFAHEVGGTRDFCAVIEASCIRDRFEPTVVYFSPPGSGQHVPPELALTAVTTA